LCDNGFVTEPVVVSNAVQAPWLFTALLPSNISRDAVVKALAAKDIETRPVFVPLHRMPMYSRLDREFPVANNIGQRGISLPTYPGLTEQELDRICSTVEEVCAKPMRLTTLTSTPA
jgi:perosamine synthetase